MSKRLKTLESAERVWQAGSINLETDLCDQDGQWVDTYDIIRRIRSLQERVRELEEHQSVKRVVSWVAALRQVIEERQGVPCRQQSPETMDLILAVDTQIARLQKENAELRAAAPKP